MKAVVAPLNPMANLGFALGPAAASIAKNIRMPQLKEHGNWAEFAAQFPVYLRQLNLGQGEPGDEQKLAHLDPCLPQVARQELQKRREQEGWCRSNRFGTNYRKNMGATPSPKVGNN